MDPQQQPNQVPQSYQEQPPVPVQPPMNQSAVAVTPLAEAASQAVKATHLAGSWSLGLGILYLLIEIPVQLLVNSGSHKLSPGVALLIGAMLALLFGSALIGFGIKLRQTRPDSILQANKLLTGVFAVLIVMLIISLLSGGGSGLLNLILLALVIRARAAIRRYKTAV